MCSTLRLARENGVERRHELVGDRAAQAAVGELDDVLLRAGGVAAALEDLAVDADVAEFVDDDGEPAALRIREHVADQRGLSRAEKAGDDGAGHARERSGHSRSLLRKSMRRHAGDQPALERVRPAAPRHQAVRQRRRAGARLRSAPAAQVGVELAEHVGPRAVAAHGGAGAALAIGEAADRPDRDSGALRRPWWSPRPGSRRDAAPPPARRRAGR